MPKIFHDFDLAGFWKQSKYARERYIETKPTAKLIASIEKELGVRPPASYVELMQSQNGGFPNNTCFPTKERTSVTVWSMPPTPTRPWRRCTRRRQNCARPRSWKTGTYF
jgi:hypothetical protein